MAVRAGAAEEGSQGGFLALIQIIIYNKWQQ
jgi:hypothetical protein